MSAPGTPDNNCRILALLWHAPHRVIAAGGFRRTYEILRRTPPGFQVVALDDRPSFLNDIDNEQVLVEEYRVPGVVRRLEKRFFWLERSLEWALSATVMCLRCSGMRLRGERFEVVYVPSSEQIPALVAGIFAGKLFGAPLVACNLNIDIFPGWLKKPVSRLHNFARVVIPISTHLEESLRQLGVRSHMEVNTVGLDVQAIARATVGMTGVKEYDAVFVGRHDPEKGVFDLLRVWEEVRGRVPGARLAMIGSCNPGNRARLESFVAARRMESNVIFMGTLSDEEKYRIIKRSRVCLFPSYVEEWGLVPQEALACGLPVVVYDLPVYRENIAGCEAVSMVETGDVRGMAERALELLEAGDPGRYESVGPQYVGRFGWDEVAAGEFDILAGARDRSRRGPG